MAIFSKESLETLRHKVDLVDVLNAHLDLKKAGAAYKGLCPFHDEKTPSFMIQKGDTHYHCFGCGAHGDAISFLMNYLKLSFTDAVENLAEKFHVHLEKIEDIKEAAGPSRAHLKEALEQACRFYHFHLLHSQEGRQVLNYLFERGLDLDFIRMFEIGLAPSQSALFRKYMHARFIKDEVMESAGLLSLSQEGRYRDFFSDRITFPIREQTGAVIGFSARKYKEETFGGKYINTKETPLFKKSKLLFGLNYSRRRIAKEGKVIVVEGQIDALRLIQEGFNFTVAGQGTAFGEGHARELNHLGVHLVYLSLDGDDAGIAATFKIGDIFQKQGVQVRVVDLPKGMDPDLFLRERGAKAYEEALEQSMEYLDFVVKQQMKKNDTSSPAAKNQLVEVIAKQIRSWDHPIMVRESLRKLAHLVQVEENLLLNEQIHTPNLYIKKSASIGLQTIDPHRILELDLLRWILLVPEKKESFYALAKDLIQDVDLVDPICRKIYLSICETIENKKNMDLLTLILHVDDPEAQVLITELPKKKINKEKAEEQFKETLQKILHRNWMQKCEAIKMQIQGGAHSDESVMELLKTYNELRKTMPVIS